MAFFKTILWLTCGTTLRLLMVMKGWWSEMRLARSNDPADISKAQAMARECMNSGYTKCGY